MQIANLQQGGEQHSPASSQTTAGTHQQEGYRCRWSLSESLLWSPTGKPLAQHSQAWRAAVPAWQHRCCPLSPMGMPNTVPGPGLCGQGRNTCLHTFKTATPLPGISGVF